MGRYCRLHYSEFGELEITPVRPDQKGNAHRKGGRIVEQELLELQPGDHRSVALNPAHSARQLAEISRIGFTRVSPTRHVPQLKLFRETVAGIP